MNSRPVRLFLAEDNGADVHLVRLALSEHNVDCQLDVAHDGSGVKDYLRKVGSPASPRPDLILLDLNLPQASGHELLRIIREHEHCRLVPVVIMTSSDAPSDRERVKALGASYYFRKPTDLWEFLKLGQVVRELTESRGEGDHG